MPASQLQVNGIGITYAAFKYFRGVIGLFQVFDSFIITVGYQYRKICINFVVAVMEVCIGAAQYNMSRCIEYILCKYIAVAQYMVQGNRVFAFITQYLYFLVIHFYVVSAQIDHIFLSIFLIFLVVGCHSMNLFAPAIHLIKHHLHVAGGIRMRL